MLINTERKGNQYLVDIDFQTRTMTDGGHCDVSFSVSKQNLPASVFQMSSVLDAGEFAGIKGMPKEETVSFCEERGADYWEYLGYGERGSDLTMSDLASVAEFIHSVMEWAFSLMIGGSYRRYRIRSLSFSPCDKRRFVATKRIVTTFMRKNNSKYRCEYFDNDNYILITRN